MAAPGSTAQSPIGHRSHARRNLIIVIAAVIVIGGAAGGYGLWYLFLRPGGPAAVGSAPPLLPSGAAVAAPASLDGTWNVSDTLGSMTDFSASWVGYRVQEQLASIGANTAVGRTPRVTGSMTLNGAVVSNVQITADLTALVSDNPNRDNQLRSQAIDTDQFPTATFRTVQSVDLGTLPAEGKTVTVTVEGALTLHGVTKTVDIALQAVRQGGIIAVTGSLPVTFADYGFSGPTSFAVLSVQDHGIMELHLLFTHA
ncbi:MAG: YceI family protein [Candidatus Limnocylindrales bacterium]|jgi:polyisoprenoid-binding protein YceI